MYDDMVNHQMIKTLLGLVLVLSLVFVPPIAMGQSYAPGYGYLRMPIRVHHSPTICAIEPQQDSNFPNVGQQLLDRTGYAVMDWNLKLNQGLGKNPIWIVNLIKVPLGQQKGFDYSKCDITIHYLPKPENKDIEFVAAGVTIPNFETNKTNIEIYYYDIQPNWKKIEWTENNQDYYSYVNEPKYTGFVATNTQLDSTIRHEIGHSLGLGHFFVPYPELQKIIKGIEDMPSIMIDTVTVLGVTHFDITPLDVWEMKSIYGDSGFDHQVTKNTGIQRIHILKTDKQNYQTSDRVKLLIDTSNFANQTMGAVIVIDSENHLIDDFSVSKSNSTLYLNDRYQHDGKYWAEFIHPSGYFDYASFTVGTTMQSTVITQNLTQQATPQIPSWIKNNAKWWSEGSLSDSDFVKGIQYMIQNGIMKIPQTQNGSSLPQPIPSWIKHNAGWWASGQVSDDEFVKTIQWLVSNGIIKA